jgi:hypothetical protein
MSDTPSHVLETARHGAAARLRELANEVHLLLNLFPDLDDSFDPDELPVEFIVKRDGRAARAATVSGGPSRSTRKVPVAPVKQAWTERHLGSRS